MGCSIAAANKEELLEMITHGADKIINSQDKYECRQTTGRTC